MGQKAGRNEAGEGSEGPVAHGGPCGSCRELCTESCAQQRASGFSAGSVVMTFVFLKDPCAAIERIKLAEVVKETGRDRVGSNCTGPG